MTGYIELKGDSGTRINFDAVIKWVPTRTPSLPFEQGDIDGEGVVETSGASLLKLKITVEMKTDTTQTALEKWDELDDFIAQYNDEQQTLSLTFEYQSPHSDQTITFTGKASKGVGADFSAGDPDEFSFSLGFTVETKGAIV